VYNRIIYFIKFEKMNTFQNFIIGFRKPLNLAILTLFLMLVGASLPFINPITPRLNSDLIAFFGLSLFGCVSCFVLPSPSARTELGSLGVLCGLWLLWACVQYIAGVNTAYFCYLLVSLSYLLAIVLLSIWVKMWLQAGLGRALAQAIMTCVLVAGLLQAVGIWLQMFQLEGWLSPWLTTSAAFPRQGGFLGQPNLCASLMICALISLVFVHPQEGQESAHPSAWRLIAMAFMMVAIFATSSRTGYLEILLLSAVLAFMRQRLGLSKVWVAMIVWQLLAIGVGELFASYGWMSGQLLDDSRKAVEASGNHRVRILKDIWLMIQHHPFMGVGWRQLQVSEVLTPGIDDPVDHAHNLLAQVQVELGIFGTLSLLGFAAYWLFKQQPWRKVDGPQLAMLCMVLALGIHSMLEYPLWHALFLFLFGFAFALLPNDAMVWRLPPRLLKTLAIAMFFFTAWFGIDHDKAVTAYERFAQQKSSQQQYIADNRNVWWNRLLFQSVFMVNTVVNDNTRPALRSIAKENANIFSQTAFINVPLLKIKIQDGETAVANQLAKRMCMGVPKETWTTIQIHLKSYPEPIYQAWLAQLPPDIQACQP